MKFDDSFLAEVGLSQMPPEQKKPFLNHAKDQLEMRVGEKISAGMTAEQIAEFEGIMNRDPAVIEKMMAKLPNYTEDPIYQKLLEKHQAEQASYDVLGEYLSVKWIQENRPDYREIVNTVSQELKAEIAGAKDQILAM